MASYRCTELIANDSVAKIKWNNRESQICMRFTLMTLVLFLSGLQTPCFANSWFCTENSRKWDGTQHILQSIVVAAVACNRYPKCNPEFDERNYKYERKIGPEIHCIAMDSKGASGLFFIFSFNFLFNLNFYSKQEGVLNILCMIEQIVQRTHWKRITLCSAKNWTTDIFLIL